ncbi:MAG: hypothetical protein A2Y34_01690 [Spirochaetes bacterium GWC1_27_15]|nr:MAG: hypothetical protein A2Z98_17470 [Spirochaetes bacterium GWB1_27_13]OHD26646.1 MAG: hypothetical protein A2Y34_01690 [Spirochaetes bacterium GWC1_27_15]
MPNILIVDDEVVNLMYLEEILKIMGHKVVGKASSGPTSVNLASTLNPDLIFMDINMPGEYDGITAAKIIEKELNIPIIFLTAYSTEHYIKEIQKFGPFGYIVKPFKEPEIKVAIHIALYRNRMEKKLKMSIERYKNQLTLEKEIQQILNKINNYFDPYEQLNDILSYLTSLSKINHVLIYKFNEHDLSFENIFEAKSKLFNNNFNKLLIKNKEELKELEKLSLITNFNNFPSEIKIFLEEHKVKSIISIPIFVENNFSGISIFINCISKYFGIDLINFFEIISNAISIVFKKHNDVIKIRQIEEEKLANEQFRLRSERLISLGQLTSSIAHEINQPLQSIKILSDSVIFWDKENKKLSYEKIIENFQKISERVVRIDNIIKNMRLILKSPENIAIEEIDINGTIKEIESNYKEKLTNNDINLILKLSENIKKIKFSEIQLQQIIINLLENSINALNFLKRDNKKIIIETKEEENYIIFVISDNGCGIPDKNKEKIFDPFFSTYQKKEGMGMGLFIITNILKSFNSTITITDNEENGATFIVRFNKNK